MKIKIICTSTGCIEYAPERYHDKDIDIIRIHVHFNGKEYLEGLDLDPVSFYAELEKLENPKDNLPYTSMPTTDEVRAVYDKAVADGYDEAIVFSLSSGLGGTYDALSLIAREYEGKIKIHVVNTKTAAFNEGMVAIKAKEFADKGMTVEQILKETDWIMKNHYFLGVDAKLDYLIYNGRLKGGKAFMGQMLKICPIVNFNENGEIVALESVRTPKKALARTCEIIKERIGGRNPEDYLLWHVFTGPSQLDILREIEKKYDIATNHEPVIMSPVSGAHNGPWFAGYGYTPLRRDDEPLD